MSLSMTSVQSLYMSVIDGVISGVREYFLDEGVDEQVLTELKHLWETRLKATKAIETKPDKPPQPTLINKPNMAKSGAPISQYLLQPPGAVPVPEIPNTKNVSIQITLPTTQQGVANGQPKFITIQVPSSAMEGNQLQSLLTGPVISASMALSPELATSLLQQHVTAHFQQQQNATVIQQPVQVNDVQMIDPASNPQGFLAQTQPGTVRQVDGPVDSSDDDDDDDNDEEDLADDDDDDDMDDKEDEENDENDVGAEEEPLNSGDDVSEEDPLEMFDTDNVVVCQYDKITRTRNKWKFYLKDGIMNLGGKDYVFQKSNGDAEW